MSTIHIDPPASEYPDRDFPWSFYFNGVTMPKWGACWFLADITNFFAHDQEVWWDWDVGPRDIWSIYRKLDHTGAIESAEPDLFLYAVQEVLCILMEQKEVILEKLRRPRQFAADDLEIYYGLVDAAFAMRELTCKTACAMWTSGYEEDRLHLVETMRRASLDSDHPEYEPAPHVQSRRSSLASFWERQAKVLHRPEWAAGLAVAPRK